MTAGPTDAARETARRRDGRFGEQERAEAEVSLSPAVQAHEAVDPVTAALTEVVRRIEAAAPAHHGGSMLPHSSASDCRKCESETALRVVREYAAEIEDLHSRGAAEVPQPDGIEPPGVEAAHPREWVRELGFERPVCGTCGVDWPCPDVAQAREAEQERLSTPPRPAEEPPEAETTSTGSRPSILGRSTTIMGNPNGPNCPVCGQKIRQGQRIRTDSEGHKVHAYRADCTPPPHTGGCPMTAGGPDAAREAARHADGRFGNQERAESDVVLGRESSGGPLYVEGDRWVGRPGTSAEGLAGSVVGPYYNVGCVVRIDGNDIDTVLHFEQMEPGSVLADHGDHTALPYDGHNADIAHLCQICGAPCAEERTSPTEDGDN